MRKLKKQAQALLTDQQKMAQLSKEDKLLCHCPAVKVILVIAHLSLLLFVFCLISLCKKTGFFLSNVNLLVSSMNIGSINFGFSVYRFNIGKTEAVAFVGLSSQNAGVITVDKAVFGSNPAINPDVLAKAFQLDKDVVKYLQSRLWSG
ncbi:germin-like protein subfamily 1 member 17 [Hibiscus syriacus]|uniref:germin-like protein subfamily 1 member 17 n=1 Tax=Hibiscus syriacus TaxID=106335 RepID=UPI0019225A05|nr:germin-like protein subfamily 1 member 17 [Hibiscus syriacus]